MWTQLCSKLCAYTRVYICIYEYEKMCINVRKTNECELKIQKKTKRVHNHVYVRKKECVYRTRKKCTCLKIQDRENDHVMRNTNVHA